MSGWEGGLFVSTAGVFLQLRGSGCRKTLAVDTKRAVFGGASPRKHPKAEVPDRLLCRKTQAVDPKRAVFGGASPRKHLKPRSLTGSWKPHKGFSSQLLGFSCAWGVQAAGKPHEKGPFLATLSAGRGGFFVSAATGFRLQENPSSWAVFGEAFGWEGGFFVSTAIVFLQLGVQAAGKP